MRSYKTIFLIILAFSVLPVIYQNCSNYSSSSDSSASGSSVGILSLKFDSSAIVSIPLSQTSITVTGQCNVAKYVSHTIFWKITMLGSVGSPTGSVTQACVNNIFSMTISLTGLTPTIGAQGQLSAYMVGIDKTNKQFTGPVTNPLVLTYSTSSTGSGSPGTGGTTGTGGTGGSESRVLHCSTTQSSGPLQDLNQIHSIAPNANVMSYTQTSVISNVQIGNGQICVTHSKLGQWPVTDPFGDGTATEGNYWVIALVNGTWYIAAYDWYRPGQACKAGDAYSFGPNSEVGGAPGPLSNWMPCPGDYIGIMASTPGRTGIIGPVHERSNIQWVFWQ